MPVHRKSLEDTSSLAFNFMIYIVNIAFQFQIPTQLQDDFCQQTQERLQPRLNGLDEQHA